MAIQSRLLGFLGRALSHELSAVQWYMTFAKQLEKWGDTEAADTFREEVVEELRHAERISERLIAHGALPNQSMLRPVAACRSLAECLDHSIRLEDDVVQLYRQAVDFAGRVDASAEKELFQSLLQDEEEHAKNLREWRTRLKGA